MACFQLTLGICNACLKLDPAAEAPPMAFEDRRRSLLSRFGLTLATAVRPVSSAPAFATDNWRDALRFALWTALPLALVAGIIPHTRTLLFLGDFQIRVLGSPPADTVAIALDVVRAGLIQVALTVAYLLSLLVPFTSLVRAYAGEAEAIYAARVLLYRIWLAPLGLVLVALAAHASTMPTDVLDPTTATVPPLLLVAWTAQMMTMVLLMLSMGFTARLACGLGLGWALVVVIVPIAVSFFVGHAGNELLQWLLPVPEGGS